MKNCTGTGETECRTEFETSCSTKYRDEAVLDTKCVKIPVQFCGEGCRMTSGEKVSPCCPLVDVHDDDDDDDGDVEDNMFGW